MSKIRKKVNKMLSPDEMAILSNISSLLDQLQQMGSVEGTTEPTEEEVMRAEDTMTEEEARQEETEEKEVKMIIKGLEETPSDSETASDDAEERMEEVLPKQTAENLSDVEKALKTLLVHYSKGITKSEVKPKVSPVVTILSKLTEVQKSNQEQLDDIGEALKNIIEGIGISKQFEVTKPVQDERSRLINKSQNDELVNVLKSLVSKKDEQEETEPIGQSQGDRVRKNLSDRKVLTALIGK